MGSLNENVVPLPTVLCTSIWPPWVVTISRAIARPSPAPLEAGRRGPEEPVKNAGQAVLGDSLTCVLNREPDGPVFALDAQGDPSTAGGVPKRVAEQVVEHVLKSFLVDEDKG